MKMRLFLEQLMELVLVFAHLFRWMDRTGMEVSWADPGKQNPKLPCSRSHCVLSPYKCMKGGCNYIT